ncbi:hypothetical protein BJ165DRAFT_1597464 [Panaeolus papilionaceus]|nr:hypothetical protein BJ165DRAFT_1597464 [Panaeolus papilionaceus]
MHSDSDMQAKVKTEPVTPTINSHARTGEPPKPATPAKKSQKPGRGQHQYSSPSAARWQHFPQHSVTGPSADILQNAEDRLEELRVRRRAASSFSFNEILLTPEQIEEIEDAREEDASCLRAGETTFFERAVRGRIEDEHWRAHHLMPAKDNLKEARRPLHGRNTCVGPVAQERLEGSNKNNGSGELVGGGDDDDIGPVDGTGRPAGDVWMSEIDPNEQDDSDEPCQAPTTPQRPKIRTVYSMSAPHVKREALPLNSAERTLIDRKRQGDEQAAIAQYRYLHLAKKREEWIGLATKELERAFTLDDIRGTNLDSINVQDVKKRKLE